MPNFLSRIFHSTPEATVVAGKASSAAAQPSAASEPQGPLSPMRLSEKIFQWKEENPVGRERCAEFLLLTATSPNAAETTSLNLKDLLEKDAHGQPIALGNY